MTVFAILLPEAQPGLAEQIRSAFEGETYQLSDTQWLVSSPLSVVGVSKKIKLYDPERPEAESLGNGVIFSTSAYYGKAPPGLWDWLKLKLEAPQHA